MRTDLEQIQFDCKSVNPVTKGLSSYRILNDLHKFKSKGPIYLFLRYSLGHRSGQLRWRFYTRFSKTKRSRGNVGGISLVVVKSESDDGFRNDQRDEYKIR